MKDESESRQQKHRKKRRSEGKCGREGCPVITGTSYYCPAHRLDNLNYKRNKKQSEQREAA